MAEPNWGMITSGATFQALMHTLVYFEDPNARLFARPGKDGGQDARSGDGTLVYQAKYHRDGSATKAISDAVKEAENIEIYRNPSHPKHSAKEHQRLPEQWQEVTRWRLVSNVQFNPTNQQAWLNKVVPKFEKLGLTADYWSQPELTALLAKHPSVEHAFFGNEGRAFLTLPEVVDRLLVEDPFLRRTQLADFCGRTAELQAVRDFLASDKQFLLLHGEGGIGKTRLLVEAGTEIARKGEWQVLWANVSAMMATSSWFNAITPERRTLLLVDDPSDHQLLQRLNEQIGSSRMSAWKIVVATQSVNDPVLRFLQQPRVSPRVQHLSLLTLDRDDAESMCRALLASGGMATWDGEKRDDVARKLASRFGSHPVWLTLAIDVVEQTGDLAQVPLRSAELAEQYVSRVLNRDPPSKLQVQSLLRWTALLGTINREDEATMALLAEKCQVSSTTEARVHLKKLVECRALIARGAKNRLVELKPDVLRDHVLLHWLTFNQGYGHQPIQPSPDARALVEEMLSALKSGNIGRSHHSMLGALGYVELMFDLSGQQVRLLDGYFSGLKAEIHDLPASHRIALAELLIEVATFRPADIACLVRALRSWPAAPETFEGLFGPRTVDHDDVILKLAVPLAYGARGARTLEAQKEVLSELCELAEAEVEVSIRTSQQLPNDGQRAAGFITSTVEGNPLFWGDFAEAAELQAMRTLSAIKIAAPSQGKLVVLNALLPPALSVSRHQGWYDGDRYHYRTIVFGAGHPAWASRSKILSCIKELLECDSTPRETRLALWPILADARSSLLKPILDAPANENPGNNRVPGISKEEDAKLHQVTLGWAYDVLAKRTNDLEEVTAARRLWQRHRAYESDIQVVALCDKLENLYSRNSLVSEFQSLFVWDKNDGFSQQIKKVEELAKSTSVQIAEFFERALIFVGGTKNSGRLSDLAWNLGRFAPAQVEIQRFVAQSLCSALADGHFAFGIEAAAGWVNMLREGASSDAYSQVRQLLDMAPNDELRRTLTLRLYRDLPWVRKKHDVSLEEHRFLRKQETLFLRTLQTGAFSEIVASTFDVEWPRLRRILENLLNGCPQEHINDTIEGITRAVSGVLGLPNGDSKKLLNMEIPKNLTSWLLDQVLRVPDLGGLSDICNWHLEQILGKLGRLPLPWLLQALKRRLAREEAPGDHRFAAVSFGATLASYVTPIDTESDLSKGEVIDAVRELVGLAGSFGSIGFHLPEILCAIDPHGLAVPSEIADVISSAADDEKKFQSLAKLSRAYPNGGASWRKIAKPVLRIAGMKSESERRYLYYNLTESLPDAWLKSHGDVPAVFVDAVRLAEDALNSEADPEFKLYWEWRVSRAEGELQEQEGNAREERGE